MKNLVIILFVFTSISAFSQSRGFIRQIEKTEQSYLDRGYKLVNKVSDTIQKGTPLVSSIVDFDYDTYYIILVQMDGCKYCTYEMKYVDEKELLHLVDFEFVEKEGLRQGVYKFQNDINKTGNFVVFLDSELPYYANIFIFRR